MMKKSETPYDIFVKKLSQRMGKLVRRDDIYELWLISSGSKSRFAYGLSKAKNQGYIAALGGGIFSISTKEDQDSLSVTQNNHILETQYWHIVALLIREHAPSGALIAHEKSIELSLRNYETPDCLVLYTRDTAKRIRIGEYEFHFRTLQSGEKTNGKNMYRILSDTSQKIEIDNHTFHTLGIESSLLDVASLKKHDEGISEELILRFIKKYEKSYSRKILGELVSYRYIRAINRIRSIAKEHGYQTLYEMTLDIIKKEGGGCYLHL